jgi:EmrB/QacA subfamily drug resistance transporter
LLPWLVAVAFFMEALDTTILNTAVPTIAAALDVPPLSMKAVLSSYTLSLAVFIPISGWMADRFGTRRVFASAIGIFTVGSLLCGVSRNIHLLVACRILQGMGGAMMLPVGRLTVIRASAKSDLIRVMSFVAMPSLIGPMLGPVAGGLLVGYFHWSVIFFVNIPIGLAGLVLVFRYLPDFRDERVPRLDFVGLVLFGTGVALLSYVLEVFGEHTLSGREMAGLLGLAGALLAAYGAHGLSVAHPLLRLELFRIATFRCAVVGSYFTRLGVGGIPFLFPLLYQVCLGLTPVQSGLLMMPQALAAMSLKIFLPRLLARFGYRSVLLCNTSLLGVQILLFALITATTPMGVIVALVFVFGLLTSTQYTSMNTLAYADVAAQQSSAASTLASTAQQMSVSFGVAAASLVTAAFLPDRFHATTAQTLTGLHAAFIALGALTMASSLIFVSLKPNAGDAVSTHGELRASSLPVS